MHLCATDPPYFLHNLGNEWTAERAVKGKAARKMCGNLRAGMRFDPLQGRRLQAFMADVSKEIYRILKPGGFYISFAQARLYHRLGVAVEDAGFEIRDMLAWKYQGQPKASSQDHFVRRMDIDAEQQEEIITNLDGRKTPLLKPEMEPMVLAQKPREGTFVDNWLAYQTGLVDVSQSLDGMFPGNVMEVRKPTKADKGEANDHPTVKPVPLIEHLIRLFSKDGQTVIDPFMGSGSHGIAAINAGRKYIGIERDPHYFDIASNRIKGTAEHHAASPDT